MMFESQCVKELNNLELSIYDYFIKNNSQIVYMTIREFADECEVSTNSILRFCNKLGFKNYNDFKAKLKEHVKTTPIHASNTTANEALGFFTLINNNEIDEKIARCTSKIKNKRNVIFIGAGSSGIMAKYGSRCLSNVGKVSFYIDDSTFPIMERSYNDDIAFLLSVSGETRETLELAFKLKSAGCELIAITSDINSTLSKIADSSICYYMKQTRVEGDVDITTQIPVIYILEALSKGCM